MAGRTGKAAEISAPIVVETLVQSESGPLPEALPRATGHEDLALFRTVEQELRGLLERTRAAPGAAAHCPGGRYAPGAARRP